MEAARTALSPVQFPVASLAPFPLRPSATFEEPLTAWHTEYTAAPFCLPTPT